MAGRNDETRNELRELDKRLSIGDSDEEPAKLHTHPEKSLRTKADYKPEVLFVGQILGADSFENQDALFLEVIFKHGKNWNLLANPQPIQTHS